MATDDKNDDESEKAREALVATIDELFTGIATQDELFDLVDQCFSELRAIFLGLHKRGVLSREDYARYQLATCVLVPIRRTLELGPQYDTPRLEQQLKQNLRANLKTARMMKMAKMS